MDQMGGGRQFLDLPLTDFLLDFFEGLISPFENLRVAHRNPFRTGSDEDDDAAFFNCQLCRVDSLSGDPEFLVIRMGIRNDDVGLFRKQRLINFPGFGCTLAIGVDWISGNHPYQSTSSILNGIDDPF